MPDDYYSITRTDSAGTAASGPAFSGTACFRLGGTLDIGAREDLQEAFRAAVTDPGVTAIRVDMAHVTFLDSEALAGLIRGYTEARQAGRPFTVTGAQGLVQRVLAVTGTLAFLG